MQRASIFVGTSGWSIPRALTSEFPGAGTHLERYAKVLPCAEINSSFYREHLFATYKKWASAAPTGFRFSVKLPQLITHELELRRARVPLLAFLEQVAGLGRKLGPLLIQLPPSLQFSPRAVRAFIDVLRGEYGGAVVCEPRHPSWFEEKADAMLVAHRIGRVAADPTRIESARLPGGWLGASRRDADAIAYFRLHGSPRKYWSRYDTERIEAWARSISRLSARTRVWCIFDNTASGAALANALEMGAKVDR